MVARVTHCDCYEKGHTPRRGSDPRNYLLPTCAKCEQRVYRVTIEAPDGLREIWHTQAELDRLWHGVDREAVRVEKGERHG